jgi:hypothetical protein
MRAVNVCGLAALFPCILVWGAGRVVTMVAPVLLAAAMAGTLSAFSRTDGTRGAGERRAVAAGCHHVAVTCGSAVLVLVLAGAGSATLALTWVGALVVTSPPVRRAAHGALLGRPVAAPSGVTAGESGDPGDPVAALVAHEPRDDGWSSTVVDTRSLVSTMDTAELCQLWRTTFWMVRDGTSPRRTACLVVLRQAALDELEQRHPAAVDQWLRCGHHGADGPARYL